MYNIADCVDDMVAYTKLTDNIFDQILTSSSDQLAPARKVLESICRRQLYKCIGQSKTQGHDRISKVSFHFRIMQLTAPGTVEFIG